jgi:hypothetical protein
LDCNINILPNFHNLTSKNKSGDNWSIRRNNFPIRGVLS